MEPPASVRGRRCLRSEDLDELVDVDVVQRALPLADILLEAGLELGAQDVDLPCRIRRSYETFRSSSINRWMRSRSSWSERESRSGSASTAL